MADPKGVPESERPFKSTEGDNEKSADNSQNKIITSNQIITPSLKEYQTYSHLLKNLFLLPSKVSTDYRYAFFNSFAMSNSAATSFPSFSIVHIPYGSKYLFIMGY